MAQHRMLASNLARDTKLDLEQKVWDIQKLDTKISTWWRGIHRSFVIDGDDGGDDHTNRSTLQFQRRMLLSIGYHQSLCVLHASIVPLFSLSPITGEHSYAQIVSAQTALDHARQISNIFRKALALEVLPYLGFVGYAAYCSCAIQLPIALC
jgi:hypothetical protein